MRKDLRKGGTVRVPGVVEVPASGGLVCSGRSGVAELLVFDDGVWAVGDRADLTLAGTRFAKDVARGQPMASGCGGS